MRQIIKYIAPSIFAITALLSPSMGHAADLPGGRSASVPMLATNWAGAYAGLHLGYGFGRSRTADIDGFLGGIHGGVNLQSGQLVYGGELDLNYGKVDYRAFADTFRQKWLGSARARVGVAFDRFLPFVTGGVAFSNATMKAGGAKATNTHIGLVVGVGAEMMVTEKLSANLQFLHYRFAAENYSVLPASRNANIVTNEIRIGMNYRF